jgi:cell division protein FtsN
MRGGTLLGIFVGLVLGLAVAAAIAYFLGKSGLTGSPSAPGVQKEIVRNGKPETVPATGTPEKPRFDFYKILPGVEEPKIQSKPAERGASDRSTAERAVAPDKTDAKAAAKPDARVLTKADERPAGTTPDAKPKAAADRFWLQAGSFANEADAEDLKARLAFAGWEAAVQSATLPDKSVRYRVRLGPYDNTDALQRMKSELAARGFDVAVIKF